MASGSRGGGRPTKVKGNSKARKRASKRKSSKTSEGMYSNGVYEFPF